MKTLFLTLTFLFSFLSFSQKLIIHVFEKQEMISFRKTSLDSVILNPDIKKPINFDHTTYEIDLIGKTSKYYINGIFNNELPVNTIDMGNGLLNVKILEKGLNYGLIVSTKLNHENVLWYWFDDYDTTVKVITKFHIEKPS